MRKKTSQRWVIKLGTGVLSDSEGRLDLPQIQNIVKQVATLTKRGNEIILVSSGAVGAGMGILNIKSRPNRMRELRACAAIGQPRLMHIYEDFFSLHKLHVAQILLTYLDLDSRSLYPNAKKTLEHLLALKNFIPIINENDVVSHEELKFGDNDQLSAHVSVMVRADRLIILSNVNGLAENSDGTGKLIPFVNRIDNQIESLAGSTHSQTSVGGMITKIKAAKLTTSSGIPTQIANGRSNNILLKICQGQHTGTIFRA
jgi:glutamate 5-kinase